MFEEKQFSNQLSRELAEIYRKMTDPRERKKEKIKEAREKLVEEASQDAGLE